MTIYWEDLSEYEREAYRQTIQRQLETIYYRTYPVAAWWGGGAQWERILVLGPCGRFPPYDHVPGADSVDQAWQLLAEFVDRPLDERGKRTAIVLAHSVTDDPSSPYWLERLPPTKRKPLRFNPDDELRQLERKFNQDPSKENLDVLNGARLRAGLPIILINIPDRWKDWVASYPPQIVYERPQSPLYECDNYIEAVNAADKLEEFHEIPCEVVWFDHMFYVDFKLR